MLRKFTKSLAIVLAALFIFAFPSVSYAEGQPDNMQSTLVLSKDAEPSSVPPVLDEEPPLEQSTPEIEQSPAAQEAAASKLELQFKNTLSQVKKLVSGKDYVADEVMIEAATELQATQQAKKIGATVRSFSSHGYAVLKLGSGKTLAAILEQNIKNGAIDTAIYPNFINYASEATLQSSKDPSLNLQYCHKDMQNTSAWKISKGSSKVTVAIIDSGIDTDHPEFSGRISSISYNSRDKKKGIRYVNDDQGHGTHVAGIIAAAQNNGRGGSGTAPGVLIMAIKANEPNQPSFTGDSIMEGIYYAADHGAKVLNMSLGRSYYAGGSSLEQKAIQYAVSKGVVVVCAAGNDHEPHAGYPAAYPECIAVSATMPGNVFDSRYSNYGPEVDVSAPGTEIYSTYPDKKYASLTGTSMATPQVAGVVALIRSYNPNYTVSKVKSKLYQTAADKGIAGFDQYYGNGAVNSYHALAKYTVKFDAKGGSRVSSVKAGYNALVSAPKKPSRKSYHFVGWYKDSACKTPWNFSSNCVKGNITLYAKWVSHNLTVKFNAQGGTSVASKPAVYGGTISAPKSPTRSGYTFGGWYKETSCTNAWNFSADKVKDNITLYARWILKTFTVTFDSQGGSAVAPVKVKQYATFQAPASPVRDGYSFAGWYKDSARSAAWNFATDKVNADTTLYAKWKDDRFTEWTISGLATPMDAPDSIAVDSNGRVYVTDPENYRVLIFNTSGELVSEWKDLGLAQNGYPAEPTGIAIDSADNVYITDGFGSNCVLKYSPSGAFIREWGGSGIHGAGKFLQPTEIGIDANGNVYVGDVQYIQKFNQDGVFFDQWKPSGLSTGIALGPNNNIYVSNSTYNVVRIYDADGNEISNFGSTGYGNGQLIMADGLEIDANGNVYVADTGNDRVQKFSSEGIFINRWGGYGKGVNQFSNPSDIAIDQKGNIYVLDSYNDRIMIKRP